MSTIPLVSRTIGPEVTLHYAHPDDEPLPYCNRTAPTAVFAFVTGAPAAMECPDCLEMLTLHQRFPHLVGPPLHHTAGFELRGQQYKMF